MPQAARDYTDTRPSLPRKEAFKSIDAVDRAFGDLSAAIDAHCIISDMPEKDDVALNARDYLQNRILEHRDTVRTSLKQAFALFNQGEEG